MIIVGKKIFFIFILILIFIFQSNGNQDRTLLFLGNENLPPYLYIENGVNKGIVIDILEEMREEMQYKFDIKLLDWTKAQEMLINGEADALLHININEERKQIYDFSNELVKSEFCIFINNIRTDIKGLKDLEGLKVGIEERGQPRKIIKDKTNIRGVYYQNIKDAFIDLKNMKIDAIIIDRWVGEYILAMNKIFDIKIIKEPVDTSFSRIAVIKGNQELLDDINKAIEKIQDDGVFKEVVERWETKSIIYMTKEQIINYVIIVIGIVFIIMTAGIILLIRSSRKLKKANKKIISLNQDIESELQSTSHMLQLVMNSIPQTIFWKDLNSVYLGCNKNFLKAVGLKDLKDLIGRTDYDLSWTKEQADSFRDYDKKVMSSGKAELHIIESALQADGTNIWADTNKIPLKNLKGEIIGILGTYEDITKRVQLEEELIKAKKKAEKASKAKSDFLVNMSHEIRTPLNGVIGFTELLKNTQLEPVQQEYVNNANVSARTLLGIINNILDFSKIEAGMLELEMIKTDMVKLLKSTMDIIKYSADKQKIELLLDIDPSMPSLVLVDPVRLKQILVNLLSNGVKFTKEGEVELKVKYEDMGDSRGKISFFVRDTGIGITEEQKEKIFKAFSQGDSSTSRKFGGTGLGLVISDLIAKKMGSKIQFDSEPGKGTTFYFDIITNIEENKKPEKETIDNAKQGLIIDDNVRILIAEDVNMNMMLIKAVIKQLLPNAELLEANNGQQAVKQFAEISPDLIFMDIQMPDMNGLDATRKIREMERDTGRKVPIIALTASAFKEEMDKAISAGMDDFLTKPIESERIKAILEKYL